MAPTRGFIQQPRVPGKRSVLNSRLDPFVEECIRFDAERHRCSRAFVISTALIEFYKLNGYERFDTIENSGKRKNNSMNNRNYRRRHK
jgi:hypothetical protein